MEKYFTQPLSCLKLKRSTINFTPGTIHDRIGNVKAKGLVFRSKYFSLLRITGLLVFVSTMAFRSFAAPTGVAPISSSACSGAINICLGATTTLTDTTEGGTWSSGNTLIATVGLTTGIVTGVATGTAIISYTTAGGTATTVVKVGTIPSELPITGITQACAGSTLTLSDATPDGEWFSSNTSIATINGAGMVTCISDGIVSINYAVFNSCGINEQFAYVVVGPSPITGITTICAGTSSTLIDTSFGGTWSSSNAAIASINPTSGNLTGVAAGTCVVTYTIPAGCTRMVTVNVIATPQISPISGPGIVTVGTSVNLADAVSGGVWSSGSPTLATVSSSGVVTGLNLGVATISYSVSNSCSTASLTYSVTVSNVYPITGSLSVCSGATTALTDATPGGTWSSGNTSVATVGATGIVTGMAAGTTRISYATALGTVTAVVAVSSAPTVTPISGATVACAGSTIPLSDGTPGGTWFSSDNTIATISSSGVVTCVDSGVVYMNYILFNSCGMNEQFARITVQQHSPINGTTSICAGASTNLTDANTGGTWSSSNTSIATIGSANGHLVGGSSANGTCTITYTVPTGCGSTATVTVTGHPATSAITGPNSVTVGSTINLTDAVTGGTWSSKTTALATINSSGVVTGVSAGVDTVSYSVSNSCFTSVVTYSVAVNNIVIAAIAGSTVVCSGSTTTLSDVTAGGTWSSSNTSVATIASTGVVTGAGTGTGTATITYRILTSFVTTVVTVNPLPGTITGTGNVCAGSATSLTDAGGGTWSSNNSSIATVDATGNVTGVAAGTTAISYTLAGCATTKTVTVNASPLPIQGATSVCVGATIALSDVTTSGTWSGSNANASVDGAGNVTGLNAGGATISYTLNNGCYSTSPITVQANPSAITGAGNVCVGAATMLSDATPGGISYTSNNASVATVASSGQVTGMATGTAIITYTIASGCMTTTTVTVNGLPAAITGNAPACIGTTTVLGGPVGSGTWAGDNSAIATIGAGSGIVTAIASGTTTVTFTNANGCMVTAIFTVNPPALISGNNMVCVGSTTTLSNASTSGTWSSGDAGIAVIGLSTGIVTGIGTGNVGITYQPASGCPGTTTVTVNPAATIFGSTSVCEGATVTLSDAIAGGTWNSNNGSIATVDASGNVTASLTNTGAVTISYTTTSCGVTTQTITVDPNPLPIQGMTSECAGTTISISDATEGGSWSSSNGNVTIDGSGNITGVSAGAATISYIIAGGCYTTYVNNVIAIPANITGASSVCIGSTTTLSDATTGGTWSSSNTASATIGSSNGIVTGVIAGTTTITYMAASGCINTTAVTVNSLPAALTGNAPMCAGGTITLTDAAGPGVWSTANTAIATVGTNTGIVTGASGGTTTITYIANATGCKTTVIVTVSPIQPINGTTYLCAGTSASLTDVSAGGTWSSSNTGIVTVGTSGLINGVSVGGANITYAIGSGCYRTVTVTVGTMTSILGTPTVCKGSTTTLSDLTAGGAWSTSNAVVASVGSTGIVTASTTTTGTTTISYTQGTCVATQVVTVNIIPMPVQGMTSECVGVTMLLTDAITGGTWSSSNTNASIDASTGNITGVAVGTSTTTYTLPDGCFVTYPNTIQTNPSAILGTATVCPLGSTALSDATSGALSWSSSNTSVASVLNSGLVTGIATGTTIITYKITSGCTATRVVTVIASPSAILGTRTVCTSSSTALSDTSGPGTWSSSNVVFATVGSATGIVVAVAAGQSVISFTLASTGCKSTAMVTVNPVPNAGSLSGPLTVVAGSTITLASNGTAGGTWSSSNGNATVGLTGIVTGVAAGSATITYSVSNLCGFSGAYKAITITTPGGRMMSGGSGTGGMTTSQKDAIVHLLDNVLSGMWSGNNSGVTVVGQDESTAQVSPVAPVMPLSISLLPNPNTGTFTVKGALNSIADEGVTLLVTDMLGNVVYRNSIIAHGGKINETVVLSNMLARGMYVMDVQGKGGSKTFHFVISK